jgi:hypothetical protein
MANTSYNRIIRKLVVGFGNLFNEVTLVRYNKNNTEQERFIVPIAYAPKELYVQRLEGDPNLDKKVQMTLPRMSFEMSGLTYDSTRKQNTNWKTFVNTGSGTISQYNPVPYNFDFNLYIYVRNIEDGTQIIEHILPYFTPDYTIKLNLVPEMGVVKEIPVILNSTSSDTQYEGPRDSDTRTIIWTLNFTVKGYIFGKTSPVNVITTSITNVLRKINKLDTVTFNMLANNGTGIYKTNELVYQGFSETTSIASAAVIGWDSDNLNLTLNQISGNFTSDYPIVGADSNASYFFDTYSPKSIRYQQAIANVSNNIITTTINYDPI